MGTSSDVSGDALAQRFQAVRAAKGKARDAALKDFLALGDDVFPTLLTALEDPNKTTRDLAIKLLGSQSPDTDAGRATLLQAIEPMLGGTKPTLRALAVELAPKLGPQRTALVGPLRGLLDRESEPEFQLKIIQCLESFGLAPDALARALESALDAGAAAVRQGAADALRAVGAAPRPTVWERTPLHESVLIQVVRLGGRPRADVAPDTRVPFPTGHWSVEDGPGWNSDATTRPPVESMPAVVGYFDRGLTFKTQTFRTWDRDFPDRTVTLTGASEHYDRAVDGRRVLLYSVAYCSLQHYYCLDLLNERPDPPVYLQDHEGGAAWLKFRDLTTFLKWLQTP